MLPTQQEVRGSRNPDCGTASRRVVFVSEVEKAGGMQAALSARTYRKSEIHKVASEGFKPPRAAASSIVGVNQYANPKEQPLEAPSDAK